MPDISSEQTNKNKRLGRGLGSLFGENMKSPGVELSTTSSAATPAPAATPKSGPAAEVPPQARIWTVGIDKLKPSPYQPRSQFDKASLEELAQSIKTSGILQPIVVRKSGASAFEIVAGERRWRAAQIAGMHDVPVIVKDFDDRQTLELALIENIQRQDLNPVEEAEAYQRLADEFNLTQQQIAEKVGRDRATVANAIRLLQLPMEVREMIGRQELSVGHAKVLLSIADPKDQKKWAQKVFKDGLSVRHLEKILKKGDGKEPVEPTEAGKVAGRLVEALREELQKELGTKVAIDYADGKGKLSIHFYSDDQLNNLTERIREGCRKS